MPTALIRRFSSRLLLAVAAVIVATLVASYQQSTGFEIATEDRPHVDDTHSGAVGRPNERIGNGAPDDTKECPDNSRRPACRQALVVGAGTDDATDTTGQPPSTTAPGRDESDAADQDDPSTTASSLVSSAAGGGGGSVGTSPSNSSCGIDSLRPGEHPPACWRPYGSSSPFNRPITGAERLHPRSAQIVARTLTLGRIADSVSAPDTRRDWYHPIYFSTADDPVYTIRCTNPDWGTCEIEGMVVHIPDAARRAAGGDGHLSVIEQHTGWEYDLWKVGSKPSGGGVLETEWGGRTRVDGDGLRSDATAAHFGLAAGVVRPEELAAGEINHALFLLVGCSAREPVFPATGKGSACSNQTDAPAIGHRFWLDMTDAEIDALQVGEWKKTILRALAHYGGFVGDTGGNEAFAIGFQSGSSYTSFGQRDPWRSFLGQPGVSEWNGSVHFNIADGVDWGGRLRVIDPCVASNSC